MAKIVSKEEVLEDTEFKSVIITAKNPEADLPVNFVGSNNIVIDGKREIKHYKFQLEREISLPVPHIEQLRNRHYVFGMNDDGSIKRVLIYNIEEV